MCSPANKHSVRIYFPKSSCLSLAAAGIVQLSGINFQLEFALGFIVPAFSISCIR